MVRKRSYEIDMCSGAILPKLLQFALPLIIGIVAGTYSANMINGYVWAKLMDLRTAKKA